MEEQALSADGSAVSSSRYRPRTTGEYNVGESPNGVLMASMGVG
jgi:hypothetical protein